VGNALAGRHRSGVMDVPPRAPGPGLARACAVAAAPSPPRGAAASSGAARRLDEQARRGGCGCNAPVKVAEAPR